MKKAISILVFAMLLAPSSVQMLMDVPLPVPIPNISSSKTVADVPLPVPIPNVAVS